MIPSNDSLALESALRLFQECPEECHPLLPSLCHDSLVKRYILLKVASSWATNLIHFGKGKESRSRLYECIRALLDSSSTVDESGLETIQKNSLILLFSKPSILDVWHAVSREPTGSIHELHQLWDIIETIQSQKHPKILILLASWKKSLPAFVDLTLRRCNGNDTSWLQLHIKIFNHSNDVTFKKTWIQRVACLVFFNKEVPDKDISLTPLGSDTHSESRHRDFVSFLKTVYTNVSLFRSVSALLLHISSSTRSSFTYFCTEPQSFYCQLPLGVRGWLRELEYIVEKFYLSKETEDELYESLVDASLSILHHSVDTVKLNRILLLEQIRPKYQCSAIPLNYAFTMVSFVLSVFEKRKLMDAKFEGSQVFRRTVFLGHLALFLKPSAVTQDNFVSHLLASQWISWLHRNQPSWTGIASHLSQWNSIRDIMGPIDRDVLQNHLLLMLKDLKNDVLAHTRSQPLDGIRRAHSAQMSTSRRNLASTTPLESDDNSITKSSLFLKQLKEDGFDVLTRCQALYISLPRSDIKTELKELIHAISDFFKAHPSSLGQSSQVHCSTLALLQSLPSSDVGKRGILSPQKPRRGMQSVLSSGRPSSRIPLPFPPTTAIHRIRLEPLPGIDPGRSQSSQDSFSLHSTDQKALDSRTR